MHTHTTDSASSATKLRLEFKCPCGRFSITSSAQKDGMFVLTHNSETDTVKELGIYQAINDAILAVLRQETGLASWDQLPPEEIPHQVHDIASWKFSETVEPTP